MPSYCYVQKYFIYLCRVILYSIKSRKLNYLECLETNRNFVKYKN